MFLRPRADTPTSLLLVPLIFEAGVAIRGLREDQRRLPQPSTSRQW